MMCVLVDDIDCLLLLMSFLISFTYNIIVLKLKIPENQFQNFGSRKESLYRSQNFIWDLKNNPFKNRVVYSRVLWLVHYSCVNVCFRLWWGWRRWCMPWLLCVCVWCVLLFLNWYLLLNLLRSYMQKCVPIM